MITQAHRFHGRSSLRFVYQRGQMTRSGPLSLRYVRNPKEKGYRVAVVVSRKVSKSAVVRNRIRRRIYELVRLQADAFTGPHDLVFTAYDEATATVSHQQLRTAILTSLTRAGVLAKTTHNRSERGIVASKETSK